MSDITMLSPGVFLEEIDKSYFTGTPSSVVVGIVGGARKGPVGVPTLITSKNDFVKIFGEPVSSDYGAHAAMQVLSSTNQLYYQRVAKTGEFAVAGDSTNKFNFTALNVGEDLNDYKIDIEMEDGSTTAFDLSLKDSEGTIVENWLGMTTVEVDTNYLLNLNGQSEYFSVSINPNGALATAQLTFEGGEDFELYARASLANSPVSFVSLNPDSTFNNSKIIVSETNNKGYFSVILKKYNEVIEQFNYLTFDKSSTNYFETVLEGSINFKTVVTPFVVTEGGEEASEYLVWQNKVSGEYLFAGGKNGISGLNSYFVVGSALNKTGLYGFEDPDALKIDIILAPGWSDSEVIQKGVEIAERRADCLFLIDPPFALPAKRTVSWLDGKETLLYTHEEVDSSYAACFAPWGKAYDPFTKSNIWLPPSCFVAAQIATVIDKFSPWAAPAGLVRGKITSIKELEYSPSKTQRDLLYSSNINSIVDFKTDGFCIWGQKTTQRIPSALDRINIRLLLNYIKKRVGKLSNRFVFESNKQETWSSWKAQVEAELSKIKTSGGLDDYRVVMGPNITKDDVSEHKMPGIIHIKPVEVAEFIPLTFTVYSASIDFDEQFEERRK